MADVATTVRTIIAELLGLSPTQVPTAAELVDELGAKHLDVIDMALEIEGDLGIVVSWERFSALRTVADVVAYVEERLAQMGDVRVAWPA